MSTPSIPASIDLGWFRHHLLDEILPRWLPSITPEGLFLSHFDREWRPLNKGYGTLVSQSRLLYNFSKGYELTADPRFLVAVEAGAAFLIDKFWDQQYGGWVWSCTQTGAVLDTRKDSYGHAFVIFGLAHACQCTGNQAFRQAALDTWQVLVDHFRDQGGGFSFKLSRDFQETDHLKSQNPIMHLFEALLALGDLPKTEGIRQAAQQVGDFVLNRLVRGADKMLPEVYGMDWQELPAEESGRIDIGHAFEWAFLLSSAVERGLPSHYLHQANHFLDYGLRIGYDQAKGGIYSPATPDGRITTRRKGWWEQCETIRALLHHAVLRRRSDLWAPLAQTIEFVQADFIDPEFGGWYSAIEPGIDPTSQDKGHEWKLDYHVVGMCMEGIRHANKL